MKKKEEIKSIKEAQRELADRLEALETEVAPKREPQMGDVYGSTMATYMLAGEDKNVQLQSGNIGDYDHEQMEGASQYTYLGTFNEVYVLRSDVEKDYVSKEELEPYSQNLPRSMGLAF